MDLFIKYLETRTGSVLIQVAGHIMLGSVASRDKAACAGISGYPGELVSTQSVF